MADQATKVAEGTGAEGFGADEMKELLRLRAENRRHRVADKVKAIGPNKAIYRDRLIVRRADHEKYAPVEDVVAYSVIHKLKNPDGDSKQKIIVSDNEIEAYKVLDPDFSKTSITLSDVLDKVDELKATGKLSKAGDNTGNGEDIVEE